MAFWRHFEVLGNDLTYFSGPGMTKNQGCRRPPGIAGRIHRVHWAAPVPTMGLTFCRVPHTCFARIFYEIPPKWLLCFPVHTAVLAVRQSFGSLTSFWQWRPPDPCMQAGSSEWWACPCLCAALGMQGPNAVLRR